MIKKKKKKKKQPGLVSRPEARLFWFLRHDIPQEPTSKPEPDCVVSFFVL